MILTRKFQVCLMGIFIAATGCTAGKGGGQTAQIKSQQANELIAAKSIAGGGMAVACNPEDFATFERVDGEALDLERETLPRGLFLATLAEMAIEKKGEPLPTRLIVREATAGKGAEIACADGLDRLGNDFEMVLTGLVKFDTKEKPEGSGLTSRQFFFFQDKSGYGVVFSNPKHLVNGLNRVPLDLRQILRASPASPQLFRVSDRAYVLKYAKEREGVRGYLLIHLMLY